MLNLLLHDTVITERDADSDHESQDADRFIAQSTFGIIQGCIENDPAPKNSEHGERDNTVDDHSDCFSTGLGEQQFICTNTFHQEEIKSRLRSGNACYHSLQSLLPSRLPFKNFFYLLLLYHQSYYRL